MTYRIMYAIKSYKNDMYLRGFDGKEFNFTVWINEAKLWDKDEEPYKLLDTNILGVFCLQGCEVIKIKISEYEETEEQLTHQHEDKGE